MSTLYSLTIRRKKLIITSAGTVVEWVQSVMRDVPARLVATWRNLHPENFVSAEIEESPQQRERATETRRERTTELRPSSPTSKAPEPASDDGYAAAINAYMEKNDA